MLQQQNFRIFNTGIKDFAIDFEAAESTKGNLPATCDIDTSQPTFNHISDREFCRYFNRILQTQACVTNSRPYQIIEFRRRNYNQGEAQNRCDGSGLCWKNSNRVSVSVRQILKPLSSDHRRASSWGVRVARSKLPDP